LAVTETHANPATVLPFQAWVHAEDMGSY